ncbi:MAG: hypothetical protein D6B27_05160 [Gammaproteobacteria bacterium]|nr:MAG: hypothetical protein D6B27_05160 [Gammaproteobacteria bacterium]
MPEIIGAIVGIAVLLILFKPFFGGMSGFWECIKFWLTPDIISLFRGNWGADWFAEMKLGLWLCCGGAGGFAAYSVIHKLLI